MFTPNKLARLLGAALAAIPLAVWAENTDVVSIPSLTVTADPLGARSPDELILPVSVLVDEELDKKRAGTLGETLDGLPGVANSDFGPGVGRPVVRGLQGSRVQVLEDGLKTIDVSGEGGDHTIAIDPSRSEQIEVFRGPATLLYGSGAAGGVINVKSNRFNPEFAEAPRVDGEFGYGFNGDERRGRLGLQLPITDSFVLRSDYSLRRSHDFDIDGFQQQDQTVGNKGTLQNSAAETDAFSFNGLLKGDWGHAGLGYSRWRTNYGVPEITLGMDEEEQEQIRADYDRIDFRSAFNDPLPGFTSARLKIAYTEFNQQEIGTELDNGQVVASEAETSFENDETDLRLEMVHLPLGLWQGVLGLQFNDRDFQADGAGHGGDEHGDQGFYVRANKTQSWGVFLLEELPTDFGRLEFAARIDKVNSDPSVLDEEQHIDVPGGELVQAADLGDRSFTPFSLSAGSIFELDARHHLRFAVTRSQRAPSAEQLYAFGSHAAAGTLEIGDPNLDEETYNNFEIGIDRHSGTFRFDATLFYNHVKDFIYLATQDDGTGNAIIVDGDTLVFNKHADVEFYGVEFTAIADLIDGPVPLSMRFSGDHVRGKLRDGGDLPRITPTRLGIGFDIGYGDWDFSVDYRRIFKQSKTAIAEDSTNGYNLVSFDLFWRPDSFKGGEVFIQGRNLLNEDGRRHTSFLKNEAPIIGRTIMTGVRFDWGH